MRLTAHLQGTSTTVSAQLLSALYWMQICDGISTPPFVLAAPLQLRAETLVTDVVVGRTHWGNRDDLQAVPHDEAMKVRQAQVYFWRRLEQQDEIMRNFVLVRAVLWEGAGLTSASARCFSNSLLCFFLHRS